MKRLPTKPDLTPTMLFNPDIKDFTCVYADDNGEKKTYVLRSYEITKFPKWLADKIAHQFADYLVLSRGFKTSYQQDKEELLKKIYV